MTSISNILDQKDEPLGVSIVDYLSSADKEIKQRVEEISESTNEKITQAEAELEVLNNALSTSADFLENEIERKTEELGNEIENMTNQFNPSTSLVIAKPSFSAILKKLLSERAISKKNYDYASSTIKSSYPAPKSYFRCLFEAYYEYNDAKQLTKDNSGNSLQMQILRKRQATQELHNYLLALENKENIELDKAKYQSDLALEVLPSLKKLININNSHISISSFELKKNNNYYKDLLNYKNFIKFAQK